MRLAFISTILGYPWGSPDRLWTDAATRALGRGDAVFVAVSPLTAAHESVERLIRAGAQIFLRRSHSIFLGHRDQLARRLPVSRRRYLEHHLEKFRPDLVVITQGATYDAAAETHLAGWLEAHSVPYVVICHNNQEDAKLSDAERTLLVRFLGGARQVLFVSSRNREWAERHLACPLPRAGLIQNPLALTTSVAAPWPKTGASARLGLIGRLDLHHKGIDLLLAALAPLAAGRTFTLTLTGPCQDRAALRQLIDRHGLAACTRLHPPVTGADLLNSFQALELFLLPSRYEGCASAMIEALMCGRPVLAAPVGGVSDWIEDGVNGFIAAAPTVESLRATLQRALAARALWPDMGTAARAAFETRRDRDPVGSLLQLIGTATDRTATPALEPTQSQGCPSKAAAPPSR